MLKFLHQQRIAIVQEMNQGAKTLLALPEPGVNYGKLTARAPELTAWLGAAMAAIPAETLWQ
jgi:hypothetical protein